MNKKQILELLAKELGYTKADVQRILDQYDEVIEVILEYMKANGVKKTKLGDLIVEMSTSKERDFKNPKTLKVSRLKSKNVVKVKYKKRKKYERKNK